MNPLHAADGEEVLPFPFPCEPEERFSLGPGFGKEEGSKKRNPIRDLFKEMRIDGIQRNGKGKARKPPTLW